MREVTPTELSDWLSDPTRPRPVLLDVREPWEFEVCRIEGSRLMPMGSIPIHLGELDPESEIVVVCHHGIRSARVGAFLEYQGFRKVINLAGGVAGWASQVDPLMPKY